MQDGIFPKIINLINNFALIFNKNYSLYNISII
jgi:hypothetical protein